MNGRRKGEAAGRRAEWFALQLLRLKGYRLVERRFRCPQGEIDLIVRRHRTLAFVEVKLRADQETAAAAISADQQSRIVRAAEAFLQKRTDLAGLEPRFDAIMVSPGDWPLHLQNVIVGGT